MSRYRFTLLLTLLTTVALALAVMPALALSDFDPTTTWNVTPVEKSFPGDRACPDGSTLFQDQFQSVTQNPEGTYSASITIDGKLVTVEITTYADNSFDFQIINGVTRQMFVKGDNYLLYQYDPKVSGATNNGPVSYDTGLHDGANPQNPNEYKDVSHLDFCLIPQADPLEVTKTAEGSYDRTVTWTLDKSVDDDSHSGYAGEIAGTSTWTVVADKSEMLDNYQVTGDIVITNPNGFPVGFSVSDTLDDGTVATVNCPTFIVPANDSVTCSYTASPLDDSATLNTAVVTSTDPAVEGDTATAPVSFLEKLIGYDEGTLSDNNPYNPNPPTLINSDTTWSYGQTFECSSDPADYGTNGSYSFPVPNTALLNDNINLTDTETVTVDCTLLPLVPSKDAAGSYDRTVTWTLDKSVDDDYHSGTAGQVAGTSNWTVVADKTEAFGNYKVSGKITIDNPAAIAQSFSVSDVLSEGGVDLPTAVTVNCPSTTVLAGGQVNCLYEAFPLDDSADLNTVTVTAAGNPAQQATAPVSFTENLIGFDSGKLSDDNPYNPYPDTVINNDTTWDYGQTFTCPADAGLYVNGAYSFQVPNTATLNGNINLSDSEMVTVDCTLAALVPTKDAAGTYDRTVTWTLDKSVDVPSHSGFAGQAAGTSNWMVVATKSETFGNYLVKGSISVYNPAGIAQTFTISDELNDGTVATVNCPSYTVAAGGMVVCSYTASPGGTTANLNTAVVTAPGNPAQQATAPVSFLENLIGYDSGTLSDPRFSYSEEISTTTNKTFPETFYCPPSSDERYVNGSLSYTEINWAYLNGNLNLSDDASVTVTCTIPYVDETAYAQGGQCFSDFGFSQWGWTIPISANTDTSFPLYAGAAGCDISKGIHVGDVKVSYDGTTVTVTFDIFDGNILRETHVYAGYDPLPSRGNRYTVAPGQYQNYGPFDGSPVYVIAHAVVGIPQ